jgi:predicted GIY-YIG superfamily endonuclease
MIYEDRLLEVAMDYVYVLHTKNARPRYIGRSGRPWARFKEHLGGRGNTHKANWISSVKGPVFCRILHRCESFDSAVMERFFIASARCFRFALTNGTEGGDGVQMTPELRELISKRTRLAMAAPEVRAKLKKPRRGCEARAEPGQETILKIAASLKQLWTRPEFREKMRLRRRAEVTEEFREKMRTIATRQWRDPQFIARMKKARSK